jgi:tripartite ATP-independent transporter DctM subunit
MTSEVVGAICVIALMVLMYSGMWIGLVMLLVGFGGAIAILGWNGGLTILATIPYRVVADYVITAVPMFVLMGVIVSHTGVGSDLFYSANKWLGNMRGGLASATVAACAGFAAITGTSMAAMVTLGKVALPEMRKYKYDESLAVGCIAAGSTIGILIPPSMGFILYGILTETSIGALFMAGIIPGILEAVFYIITIYLLCRINPKMGPKGPKTGLKEKIISLNRTWPVALLFLIVMGGIYMGIFTPTEAGAVGAFGIIVITLFNRQLTRKNFTDSILDTAQLTAMMILIIVGAFVFMKLMTVSRLPIKLSELIAGLPLSKYYILVAIIFVYIILGMFLDVMACIIVTVPIFFPIILAMGFNPVWYGVLMVRIMEVGAITPPIGMGVFLLSGVTDVPLEKVYRGILPFVLADIVNIALIIAVPAISLYIPSTMM